MAGLTAKLVAYVFSPDGPQADIELVEPNGDAHRVRCLCRGEGTELGEIGDGQGIAYLNERYGPAQVCAVARNLTLGPPLTWPGSGTRS